MVGYLHQPRAHHQVAHLRMFTDALAAANPEDIELDEPAEDDEEDADAVVQQVGIADTVVTKYLSSPLPVTAPALEADCWCGRPCCMVSNL